MAKLPFNRLLATGIVGTIVATLCCFTPVLVTLLGMLGLSALAGVLDIVLLPALAVFIGMTIYALAKQRQACRVETRSSTEEN